MLNISRNVCRSLIWKEFPDIILGNRMMSPIDNNLYEVYSKQITVKYHENINKVTTQTYLLGRNVDDNKIICKFASAVHVKKPYFLVLNKKTNKFYHTQDLKEKDIILGFDNKRYYQILSYIFRFVPSFLQGMENQSHFKIIEIDPKNNYDVIKNAPELIMMPQERCWKTQSTFAVLSS